MPPARDTSPRRGTPTASTLLLSPVGLLAAFGAAATAARRAPRAARSWASHALRPRAEARIDRRSSSRTPTAAPRCCSATWSRPTTPTRASTPRRRRARPRRRRPARLDARRAAHVEFGALLHDVGKIAIPNEIINKPGPLDDDEWAIIKTHTVEGQRILERVGGLLARVGVVVRASPRALGRRRLPRRPRGRGDPARGAHRLRLRRLQRDDDRPLLPQALPPGGRRAARATPAPSSTPRRRRARRRRRRLSGRAAAAAPAAHAGVRRDPRLREADATAAGIDTGCRWARSQARVWTCARGRREGSSPRDPHPGREAPEESTEERGRPRNVAGPSHWPSYLGGAVMRSHPAVIPYRARAGLPF